MINFIKECIQGIDTEKFLFTFNGRNYWLTYWNKRLAFQSEI